MGKVVANFRLPVSPFQSIILREFGNVQIVRDYQSASLSTLPRGGGGVSGASYEHDGV